MKRKTSQILIIFILTLVSCTGDIAPTQNPTGYPSVDPTATIIPTQTPSLLDSANRVVQALVEKDLETVAEFVHPERGVRFSPYATVQEDHQVFKPEELPGLIESDTVYTWGREDGSGNPIELTFAEYFDEFVASADFSNAEEVAVDEVIGQGNTPNNIGEFYPESSFVEYHFSGFDAQYEGLDWESLRLVFTEDMGTWFLIGIVHDAWTV